MKKLLTVFLIIFSCSVFSQKFELGKVSVEELKERVHPLDPSASAAILYKKGSTRFEIDGSRWILVTEVEVRLKVYSKEGYDNATVSIPYYQGGGKAEGVLFSDAVTYNLSGDKIIKTKLSNAGEFVEDISKVRKLKKITLPNVQEGSIVEYKYILKSPFFYDFPDWYFQDKIPVNKVEYSVAIPQFFVYNRILNPYFSIKEKEESYKRNIHLMSSTLTVNEVKRIYIGENLPALKNEDYVDNINNYLSFVKHELASSFDFDGKEEKYATDWNSVIKTIYGDDDFGKQLRKTSYFKQDIDELVKSVATRDELINAVFKYVRDRMVWDGYTGYTCGRNIEESYSEKTGNVGEINLMLVAMLRYAGFNANPVLLSTRKNGHVTFVSLNSFNYVIAGVEGNNGDVILLDATNKNALPNILPTRDLNGNGRLIREGFTSREVDLMPKVNSLENIFIIAKVSSDGVVTGQVKARSHDYNAFVFKDNYPGAVNDDYLGKKEKELGNIAIDSYVVQNDKEYAKPVEESFNFKGEGLCDNIGGKIYISPMLFYTMSENPFKQEERTYPVYFVFPRQTKYTISITVPDGYTVESLPKAIHLNTDPSIAEFKFNAIVSGSQIQISVVQDINYASIDAGYYSAIKEIYAGMVKKQTEKIVLVKK